ncbi:DUF6292 family protein [Amycolatopsis thermoflava]|uniref:DUF6292 family protein n=1 Tax=Amycolatopsis thermoflava TaxID=84480 RepID=UPI0012FBC37C|nr:DUF6292 family protein [Amycolatopsis thermoflava]
MTFDFAFETVVARGLHRYVRLVAHELGLRGNPYCVQVEPPLSAYLALDRHLPDRVDRELGLTWDEQEGWALGVETECGEDLVAIRFLGSEPLPPPAEVAAFARQPLKESSRARWRRHPMASGPSNSTRGWPSIPPHRLPRDSVTAFSPERLMWPGVDAKLRQRRSQLSLLVSDDQC